MFSLLLHGIVGVMLNNQANCGSSHSYAIQK